MDLHKLLKPYEYSKKLYRAEAAEVLFNFLAQYSEVHSWFHCYCDQVEDSDPEHYSHYVVTYWSDGTHPTTNIFNFRKEE